MASSIMAASLTLLIRFAVLRLVLAGLLGGM